MSGDFSEAKGRQGDRCNLRRKKATLLRAESQQRWEGASSGKGELPGGFRARKKHFPTEGDQAAAGERKSLRLLLG